MDLETLEIYENYSTVNSDYKYTDFSEIDKISCLDLSYEMFLKNYMLKNVPVVITNVSDDWECSNNWIISPQQELNIPYLSNCIALDTEVPVTDCNKSMYNVHEKTSMKFHDFLTHWSLSSRNQSDNKELIYLKDWHLRRNKPEYQFYMTPKYFASDFLNEYLIQSKEVDNDYMFVYFGPKNTWTPLHADVFGSYSWSTNIFGKKKWILIFPGEENKLRDSLGNLPTDITESILKSERVKFITLIQNPNETLFVPTDWYHEVWNIEDSISINHNWFNACNLMKIWINLKDHYLRVVREIDDCADMDGFPLQCQILLKASFGMNYSDFFNLLKYVSDRRVEFFNDSKAVVLFDAYELGEKHILFDLKFILKVLYAMQNEAAMEDISLVTDLTTLIERMEECLQKYLPS